MGRRIAAPRARPPKRLWLKKVSDCGLGLLPARDAQPQAATGFGRWQTPEYSLKTRDLEATFCLACDLGPRAELGTRSRHLMTTAEAATATLASGGTSTVAVAAAVCWRSQHPF
jgi:hypothetical protein